jgi:hypothetical protein
MTTSLHIPFSMGEGGEALSGALLEIDAGSGRVRTIERIWVPLVE